MNCIKFNDWQEMALKKDTESILRKLDKNQPVILSVCWDLVISAIILLLDHLFSADAPPAWVWYLGIAVAVLPPLIVLLCKFVSFISGILKVRRGKFDVKNLIDLFDNQICYWVMTGNSYGKMLSDMRQGEIAESVFFYQECCYYNNKAIGGLYRIMPIISKIFAADPADSVKNSTIQLQRLTGIIELIKLNDEIVHSFEENISGSEETGLSKAIDEQRTVNRAYREQLDAFIIEANKVFKVSIERYRRD